MSRIIEGEFYKVISVKSILLVGGFLLGFIIVYSYLFEVAPAEDWRIRASEMLNLQKSNLQVLNDLGQEKEIGVVVKKTSESIFVLEYSLENDIPYNVSSMYFYVYKLTQLFPLLNILCVILSSQFYHVELENDTWKNILSAGIDRRKILLGKIVSAIILTVGIYILVLLFGSIIGALRFGTGLDSLRFVEIRGNQIAIGNYFIEAVKHIAINGYRAVFFTLLTYSFLLYTNHDKLSVIATCILMLVSGRISAILQEVAKFTPFYFVSMEPSTVFSDLDKALWGSLGITAYMFLLALVIAKKGRKLEV